MVQDGMQVLKVSGRVDHHASMVEAGLVVNCNIGDFELYQQYAYDHIELN